MTQKIAFVFPGQGSQSVGMLRDVIAEHSGLIEKTFAEASDALGYDLFSLVWHGPSERLNLTEFTQPAILTASVALWRIWLSEQKNLPTLLAGHSLGEYSALVCANSLTLRDAVTLVARRGRLMQAAVPEGEGAMAAILGLTNDVVAVVCEEASQGDIVAPANDNSIGQVVVSGHKAAVLRAIEIAKAYGAKRTVQLPVSIPSHCALMKPAAELLEQSLRHVPFKLPDLPIVHNVDVQIHSRVEAIKEALVAQLYRPVRWVETIRYMALNGVTHILECGPGVVLSGLNRRIESAIQSESFSKREALYL